MPAPKEIEILEWYGLNSKTSEAALPLGFSNSLYNMDLSIPGVAKTIGGFTPFTVPGIKHIQTFKAEPDQESGVTSVDRSFLVRPAPGSLIVVSIVAFDGGGAPTISDVTDNQSNAYVSAVEKVSASGDTRVALYYAKNIDTGTPFTVTVDFSGSCDAIVVISEFVGADPTSPLADTSDANGSSTAPAPGSLTPAEDDSLFIGVVSHEAGADVTITPDAAYEELAEQEAGSSGPVISVIDDMSDDASNPAWTLGSSQAWTAIGACFTPAQDLGGEVSRIFDFYRPDDQVHHFLVGIEDGRVGVIDSNGILTNLTADLTPGEICDFVKFKNTCYFGNGEDDNMATDGSVAGTRKWGIAAPSTNPSVASGGAGALTGVYKYKVTFYNDDTGHESNANPGIVQITTAGNDVDMTSIPVSTDPQVTRRRIYRTTSGGGIYFFLHEITDNTTTTYTDNAADSTLGTTEVPEDNDPPDDFVFLEEWDGRIWGAPKNSTTLHFCNSTYLTPSGTGLPEESFSQDNRIFLFKEIRAIKKSPTFNELWVHLEGGEIIAIQPTGDPDDPYIPVQRANVFSAVSHYAVVNIYNQQWYIDESARIISIDSSGFVRYVSENIEPNLVGDKGFTGANFARLKFCQAVHYKKGTKNQYRIALAESGQTTFNRVYAANYLQMTPADAKGDTHPVWEEHRIGSFTALGIVKDTNNQDILYSGSTDSLVMKQDFGTNFNGTAIEWSFSIGWSRTAKTPDITDLLRWIKAYFNPTGNYNISMLVEFDFGTSGGQVYSLNLNQTGDELDVDFILDESLLAGLGLKPIEQDVGGDYNYVRVTFMGNALDQTMELHNVVLMPIQTEGFRRHAE
ncbi:MAG: hypothetical protein MOGMAGMI_01970 [Candidatus Omnitrophica bacterium]|nr:hypothetical protein [Candidatus Omnitrophota bacterium]